MITIKMITIKIMIIMTIMIITIITTIVVVRVLIVECNSNNGCCSNNLSEIQTSPQALKRKGFKHMRGICPTPSM